MPKINASLALPTALMILGGCGDASVAAASPAQPTAPASPITQAMTAIEAAIPKAAADPNRPVYHFHAPAQWMNDPNGFIRHDGWYHMFYQFNPYGSDWGNMHWGHARSKDLTNWQQLPVALWPSHDSGEEHVYSGSVFPNASGTPMAFYTSIGTGPHPRDPEVWAALPLDKDMIRWEKLEQEPVVSEKNMAPEHIDEWRDPFLVSEHGVTYLVTGGELKGHGVVCLYQATNGALTEWTYRGAMFHYPDGSVPNIECPNLVRVDGRWVLLISVHGQIEYFIGMADLAHCTFTTQSHGVLNPGSYASQANYDGHGRAIEVAWVRPIGGPGWAGCLTLPSYLSINKAGAVVRTPVESLARLRGKPVSLKDVSLVGTQDLTSRISGDTLEITAQFQPGTAKAFGLRLRQSPDGTHALVARYDCATHTLSIPGLPNLVVPPDASTGIVDLHFYLDKSLLDVYAAGGSVTATGVPTPAPKSTDLGVAVFSEGGTAHIESLKVYPMKPATFDLSRFH